MSKVEQVLFSGNSHAAIHRDSNVRKAATGTLDLNLSAPGGENLDFTGTPLHPRAEQLFSGAWAACYISAFENAASMKKLTLPSDYSIDIQVSIGSVGAGYCLAAQFSIRTPGLAKESVEEIAQLAHETCPYSKAVRGNIEVGLNVVAA